MGCVLTHVVPSDPWHLPSPEQLDSALTFVRESLHADSKAQAHGHLPQAFFGPETRFATTCPACGTQLDFEEYTSALADAYDGADASLRSLPYTTPCCNKVRQATDFDFPIVWANERPNEPEWRDYKVAAFARADVCLWDFRRLISTAERAQINAAMGCPIKLVWYGI